MSKKTYYIRINCIGFQDYEVKAKNKQDAVNEARRYYQCDCTEGEFGEFLDKDSVVHQNEAPLEVYYPEVES